MSWPGRGGLAPTERGPARVVRRHRRRVVVGAVVTAAALTLFALVATDTLRVGARGPHLAARATRDPVPDTPGPTCRSPLTPTAPLRLWIGGDSLAGSLGPSLGAMAAETGVVAPVFDSRVSSGLADPGFFDWPQHATEELARLDPEVVVFIIGTNDWMLPQDQPTDSAGTPVWKSQYTLLVEQMLAVLSAPHRFVYWVGAPTIQNPATDAGVRQINAVARAVVAGHPDAAYVDAYQLFANGQGQYSADLPVDGQVVDVRTGDGVHFTPAGADYLAHAIFDNLDTRCRLDAQAVPSAPQPVVETPGSTQLPNTYVTPPRLSIGAGSGTGPPSTAAPGVPPTSPATAAPTTVPTTTTTPSTSAPIP